MNYSKSHITEEIKKLIPECSLKQDKVFTSGKHYFGWVKDRLVWDTQVLVNAVKCNADELPDMIRKIEFQLKEEFRPFLKVSPVVFEYTDMSLLTEVVNEVSATFGTDSEVLQDIVHDSDKVAGCIILTAVSLPKIGS